MFCMLKIRFFLYGQIKKYRFLKTNKSLKEKR
jgi:hypothetical protein